MNLPRSMIAALALVVGLALAPVGHAAGSPASLKTRHGKIAGKVGTFLVDAKGKTLYLFQKDTSSKSRCSGACAADWPPLLTSGKPKGVSGVRKSLLGTTKRSDGTTQVTYNKHPLYYYAGDTKAGDTGGQGVSAFGARWYAVTTSGRRVGGGY